MSEEHNVYEVEGKSRLVGEMGLKVRKSKYKHFRLFVIASNEFEAKKFVAKEISKGPIYRRNKFQRIEIKIENVEKIT